MASQRWCKLVHVGVCVGLTVVVIHFVLYASQTFLSRDLISDEELRRLYSIHRKEIERLRDMCSEDQRKAGVSLFVLSARTREVDCVRKLGGIERCQEYARLFAAARVARVSWEEGCVWLLADGWGWAGKGVRKGLMYKETALPPQTPRSPQRYEPIQDGWYIYEISPRKPLFDSLPSLD